VKNVPESQVVSGVRLIFLGKAPGEMLQTGSERRTAASGNRARVTASGRRGVAPARRVIFVTE
jgi:hypothetical protein